MEETLRAAQRRRRSDAMVASALALFAERGVDAVSVDEICERAMVSRATFFNYFPAKESVFAAVARRRLEALGSLLRAHGGGEAGGRAGLLSLFRRFAAENASMGEGARVLLPPILARMSTDAELAGLQKQARKVLARIVATLQREGEARLDASPVALADAVWSVYLGSTVAALTDAKALRGLPADMTWRIDMLLGAGK